MNHRANRSIRRAHDVRRHTQTHAQRDRPPELTREQRELVAIVRAAGKDKGHE